MTGNSFEEVGKKSHGHVMRQINSGEEAHEATAEKMKNALPEEQKFMMTGFEKSYNEAPEIPQ